MKTKYLPIFLVFIFVNSFGQDNPNKLDLPFKQLLKETNANFTMPDGFIETSVTKNTEVFYQYAIKEPKSNFEVRYFIRPYNLSNTNHISKETFISTILNAAGNISGQIPHVDEFPKEYVKNDFNADWGATSAFQPLSRFGLGFNLCSIQVIKKENIGEIYIFWMFNDPEKEKDLLLKTFSLIKFNP